MIYLKWKATWGKSVQLPPVMAIPFLLSACTSTLPANEAGSYSPSIPLSGSATDTEARRTDRFGVWFESNGFGFGFRSDTEIRFPEKCQIVFLVSSEEQLSRAVDLITRELDTQGENICIDEL